MTADIETYRGFVYPWEMDHVGHLNVQFYVRRFDEASWHFLASLGLTPTYLREQRRGVVAREQRITYHAEVRAGGLLVVRSRLTRAGRSSLGYTHVMHDGEDGRCVATMELAVVHIDADARRACPLPDAVAHRARAAVGA